MPTAATHVWRPSTARRVTLDSFVPVPRGAIPAPALPLAWASKDPADVLDYVLDFSPAFAGNDGDSIAALDVAISPSAPGDLVLNQASVDGAAAVLWLAGGQANTKYTITISVTAQSGRVLSRSVGLWVSQMASLLATGGSIDVETGVPLTDQNGNPVLAP